MEVLLALTIVAILSTPVFLLIRNSLVSLARHSDSVEKLFAMENVLVEQTFKAVAESKIGVTLQTTEKSFDFDVNYVRSAMPKFKGLTLSNRENMSMQKAAIVQNKKEDFIVSFLYKPRKKS